MVATGVLDDLGDVLSLGLVERARAVAVVAHAGQVDKAGAPYISHPYRVAGLLDGLVGFAALSPVDRVLAKVAAYLHDAVEDSDLSFDALAGLFPDVPGFVSVVEALTHRPHEPRVDYYVRVRANRVALVVKEADLLDNTDPERMAVLEPELAGRLGRKYAKAFNALGLPLPQHLEPFAA